MQVVDAEKIWKQIREANLRHRNKRPFEKEWHLILHYSYFFLLIHNLILIEDDPDATKAFETFCEMCKLDLKHDFQTFEQFQKAIIVNE